MTLHLFVVAPLFEDSEKRLKQSQLIETKLKDVRLQHQILSGKRQKMETALREIAQVAQKYDSLTVENQLFHQINHLLSTSKVSFTRIQVSRDHDVDFSARRTHMRILCNSSETSILSFLQEVSSLNHFVLLTGFNCKKDKQGFLSGEITISCSFKESL
jgi:hypothetical protein